MGGRSFALPCLLLFATVAGVSLQQALPNITASDGEVFSLPLTSYFAGNNLAYSLSANDNVEAANPFSLEQQTNFPYAGPNTYDGTTPDSKLLDSFTQLGQTYVLNAVNSDLQAYVIDTAGTPVLEWTYTIVVEGTTPTITRITHYTSAGKLYSIVLVRSIADPLIVFEGYLFDISDMTLAPADPTALGLQSAKYFSQGDILLMGTSAQTLLLVDCDNESDQSEFIMVYDVTEAAAPLYLWDLSSYADGSTLAPISIATANGKLYILDTNKGLVSFQFVDVDTGFEQAGQLNVNRLGTPTFLEAGSISYLAIGTSNGLLIVDQQSDTASKWVPIDLASGLWEPYSAFFSDDFVFVTAMRASNMTVVAIDLTLPFTSCVQAQWFLDIPEASLLPFGMYTFVQLLAPQSYVYLRSDVDALNVYNVKVGWWSLTGTTNAAGTYSVDVTAFEADAPSVKVSSTLTVKRMAATNNTVYFGSGFNLTTSGSPVTIVPEIAADSANVSIPVSSWFSGPQTGFKVTLGKAPAGITLNSSFAKIEVDQAPSHEFLENDGVLMTAENQMLYVRSSKVVLKSVTILWFDYYNSSVVLDGMVWYTSFTPSSMTVDDEDDALFMVGKIAAGTTQLSGYRHGTKFKAATVSQTCFRVKLFNGQILCVSPGQIDLYVTTDLSSIVTITPAMLGLSALQIMDVAYQVSHHNRNLLYISCALNGLFTVDITDLAFAPATLPVLMGLPSATSGYYLSLLSARTLVQVNQDGSVLVLDVWDGPSMHLRKTIPSWITGTLCGATNTNSFAVVCIGGNLLFYDVESTLHNALFSNYTMGTGCSFQSMDNEVFTLCQTATDSIVSRIAPIGTWGPQGFVYNVEVSIALNFTQITSANSSITAQVNCSSPGSNSVVVPVTINLQNEGHSIFHNISAAKAMRVHYEDTSVFPLSSMFSGQNIDYDLFIDGKNRYCPDMMNATDPVIVKPTFERVSFAYDYSVKELDSFVFLEPGVAVTISDTSLHIFKVEYDTSASCLKASQATQIDDFDLLPLMANQDLTECPLMTIVTTNSESSLLAVYCHAKSGGEQLSLIKLDLNICGCGLAIAATEPLSIRPTALKTKSSGDGRLFVTLLDGVGSFLWGEFTWLADGSVSFTTPLTLVDFISLQLDHFCPADVEMQPLPGGAAIYVADTCFGVRTLNYTAAVPSVTIESSYQLDSSPAYGISMCNGSLYTIQANTVVTQYNFTGGIGSFKSVKQIPDFNAAQGIFAPNTASLVCSDTHQLLAARMDSNEGYQIVRVFDLLAKPDSGILGSFRLDSLANYSGQSVTFSNDAYLAVLTSNGFSIYHVSRPYLYFPALLDAEYNAMIDIWGSHDFKVIVSAVNDEMQLNSTTVPLKRDSRSDSDEGFGSKYWWAWVTIAIIAILVAASCFFCRKRIPGPQDRLLPQDSERGPQSSERPVPPPSQPPASQPPASQVSPPPAAYETPAA